MQKFNGFVDGSKFHKFNLNVNAAHMAKILIRQRMKDFKLNAVAEFVNEWHEDTLTYTSSDYLLTDTVEEIADALIDQYHIMQPDARSGSREVSKKDRYEVRKHIVLKLNKAMNIV